MARFLVVLLMVCVAATSAASATSRRQAPAAPPQGALAWPAVGGQGSTVLVRFMSIGCDDGIDGATCGYTLALTGPENTPCAGEFVFNEIVFFPDGPATFRVGPRARPTSGRLSDRVRAYRPTTAWCPGVYRGSVDYNPANSIPGPPPASFTFRIDRTRRGRDGLGRAPKDAIQGFCRPKPCDL